MGQEEILKLLKENPDKWFGSREIAKAIGTEYTSALNSLRRMRHYNEITFKIAVIETNRSYLYKYKK